MRHARSLAAACSCSRSYVLPLLAFAVSALLSLPRAEAAEAHTLVLGPNDKYEITETRDRRYEVLGERTGQFADVRIKPKRGDDFNLTLYFLDDTPELGKLNTPEKIASSVAASAEKYLPQAVEKQITLQAIAPRRSYGSLLVLTAADFQGTPGEFKYQTRGMVRLSPDAALGFSLLSREVNTAAYKQWLNYVYSFIQLVPSTAAPAQSPAPKPTLTNEADKPKPTLTPQQSAEAKAPIKPAPKATKPTPRSGDMRDCLSLPSNADIMRCVNGRK